MVRRGRDLFLEEDNMSNAKIKKTVSDEVLAQIEDLAQELKVSENILDGYKETVKEAKAEVNSKSLILASQTIAATFTFTKAEAGPTFKKIEEIMSEGTRKKMSGFRGRFIKANKKLPMSGDFETDVKTVLDVFEAENIKTKKDMDDYGKEEHVLNPIIEKLLQDAVTAAGSDEGFLMEDELSDFEAALRKPYTKFDKKNLDNKNQDDDKSEMV